MVRRKLKKGKAYQYNTFSKAKLRGFSYKQWINSKVAKKRWDNLPVIKKEIQLDNLKQGREVQRLKRKFDKPVKEKKISQDYVEVYEITSQSHYDAIGRAPNGQLYESEFEYTTKGYFENEPSIKTIEKMVKNSLIGAFNSGKKGSGGYLTNKAFNSIVEPNLRGVQVQKVRIAVAELTNFNQLKAELSIKNFGGNKWIGRN